MSKASRFHQAKELSSDEEKHNFDPQQEFLDTLDYLLHRQQQEDCDTIIQQLNNKPSSDWSVAERQLYLKAISARAT
jgi:hypothetical protein